MTTASRSILFIKQLILQLHHQFLLSLHASLTCISVSAWPLGAPDSPCSSLQT